jgi:hypothetical protein
MDALPLAAEAPAPADVPGRRLGIGALALGALGVVYGDIGTSPLYAIKECFAPHHGLPPTPDNVLGILSLVLWSLLVVIVSGPGTSSRGNALSDTASRLPTFPTMAPERPATGSDWWRSRPPCGSRTAPMTPFSTR